MAVSRENLKKKGDILTANPFKNELEKKRSLKQKVNQTASQ
jgi:hypothetical protein